MSLFCRLRGSSRVEKNENAREKKKKKMQERET